MTVAELIKYLHVLPGDWPILVATPNDEFYLERENISFHADADGGFVEIGWDLDQDVD